MDFKKIPVLASTGLPREWDGWSEEVRKNYVASRMFDDPPGWEPEVVED